MSKDKNRKFFIPAKTVVLSDYKIELRTHERRRALLDKSAKIGVIKVMKYLNSIRENSEWNPRAHEIMTKDLEFLEKEFQKEKLKNQKLKIKISK